MSSSPNLTSCTIAENSADFGSGVYCVKSTAHLTNCIVWDNVGGSIWTDADSSAEVRYSCIETSEVWPGTGNINLHPRFEAGGFFDFERVMMVEMDGEFRELPDYVVEAPDYHLRPDSPCIDSGTREAAPASDLEENVRPCGPGVDIGAFEMGGCAPFRFLRGDCNGDANVDLSDAVCTLNWLFAGGEAPGCLAAANTNGDAAVNLPDAIHALNFLFVAGPPPAEPYPACAPSRLAGDRTVGCENPPVDCE